MTGFIKRFWGEVFIIFVVLAFFWQFLLKGMLPIPSDTIIGLYHPFRDLYANDYPRGIPFKNFLITDPVRQIIPWKSLSIELLSRFELPLWNPYEMAGKPLLGNFQSSLFYPFNLVLFIKPFHISWSVFIMIQPLLASVFMFYYLRNLKLDPRACVFGAIAFSFSGFSVSWLEWGNIVHTALWLPLILLSIDKLVLSSKYKVLGMWGLILLGSLFSSFFAGHLQIFFYVYILSVAYFLYRWFENDPKIPLVVLYLVLNTLFLILTSVQWLPTLQFINLSARSLDQNYSTIEGWFMPWQHLVQFIIPDFFGNPTTLNYWGTWNYGELVGYVGIITLFFVFVSVISKLNRTKLFFVDAIVIALLFSTDNPIARIPFEFNIPLISSSQPTRLIFLISFSLSVLGALGLDSFLKQGKDKQKIILSTFMLSGIIGSVWLVGTLNIFGISPENLRVLKRNLYFPTAIFGLGLILVFVYLRTKNIKFKNLILFTIIAVITFDLLRFAWKYTPFTNAEYFYPQTKVIEFLKKDKDIFRIATADPRILAPNIATYYKIQTIDGYDPLYPQSYAELIAASERGEPNINPPFGFNRIINPHNIKSKIIDFLNVKYILSLSNLDAEKFEKVFQEGQTRVYKNTNYFDRAFFVENVVQSEDTYQTVRLMFAEDLANTAIVSNFKLGQTRLTRGSIKMLDYSENKIVLETDNAGDGFLVLTDVYYPTWKAKIDGVDTKIYKTNLSFRGIFVPGGKHKVMFYNTLF